MYPHTWVILWTWYGSVIFRSNEIGRKKIQRLLHGRAYSMKTFTHFEIALPQLIKEMFIMYSVIFSVHSASPLIHHLWTILFHQCSPRSWSSRVVSVRHISVLVKLSKSVMFLINSSHHCPSSFSSLQVIKACHVSDQFKSSIFVFFRSPQVINVQHVSNHLKIPMSVTFQLTSSYQFRSVFRSPQVINVRHVSNHLKKPMSVMFQLTSNYQFRSVFRSPKDINVRVFSDHRKSLMFASFQITASNQCLSRFRSPYSSSPRWWPSPPQTTA